MPPDPDEERLSASIHADVDEWLAERAETLGVDRETLVRRLLTALHAAAVEGPDGDGLAARVAALEADLDEKIADVRERVIQLKLEADAKAPADHGHPDLETRLSEVGGAARTAAARVDDLRAALDALERRAATGFENYESVLDGLADRLDGLEDDLDTLAGALVDTRERVSGIGDGDDAGRALDALLASANRNGVRTARCGACGGSVRLGLLARPRCPHCERRVSGLDVRPGWLRTSRLEVETPPALEGEAEEAEPGPVRGATDGAVDDGEGPTDGDRPSLAVEGSGVALADDGVVAADRADGEAGRRFSPVAAHDGHDAVTAGDGERPDRATARPVEEIDGIGPAYGERLRAVGIETVTDLAGTDPEALAEDADVSAVRLRRWITQADRLGGG